MPRSPAPESFDIWRQVNALSDLIFWEASGEKLTYISEGVSSLLGMNPEEVLQSPKPWFNRIYTRHRARYHRAAASAREHGSAAEIEYRASLPNTGTSWLRDHFMYDPRTGKLHGITMQVGPQHQAQERLAFINKAAQLMASTLSTDDLLGRLAELIVGSLADHCLIEFQQDENVLVIARSDAGKQVAARLEAEGPMILDGRLIPAQLRKDRAILEKNLSPTRLRKLCGDSRLSLLSRSLPHSAILVPLMAGKRCLGIATLLCSDKARDYIASDVSLARDLARRAATALDHARLFEEAKQRQEDLVAENEMKDEFLAIISHELRSPLTVIYGVSRLLPKLVPPKGEDLQQLLEDLNGSSEQAVRLVDDLMLLARLNLGQQPDLEPVRVETILREVSQDFLKQRPERVLTTDDGIKETALGAPAYTRQILLNLLSNAHKYSPAGGPINLSASVKGKDVVFTIVDSGKGVPESELDSIFDRFHRASTSAGVAGSGMGLAICRRLVEAQEGRIWAENATEGGLAVSFSLPLFRPR